jgi:ABC-2 type transport system ATP-binding protein
MAAIEILGLEKTYQVGFLRKVDRVALKPLQLAVEEGEVYGYLGPNGAGKTTTLKLLMGLIFPSGGTAKILGRDFRDPEVKSQIGFLPEQPYFYDYLTAEELLAYYAQLSGVPAGEIPGRITRVLERVGMGANAKVQLRKFSKGMLQRIGIAQAIIHDPKLVFLDEPMSGLDPMGRLEVRDLIASLKDEGKTVFFSTHILSDAETLCDRVAVLNQGELRAVGVVADLTREIGGKVEVVWEGAGPSAAIKALGTECHATANLVRATLPEAKLDAAIDAVRRGQGRLVSVTPVRATLEDYFLEKLGSHTPAAAEVAR